MGNLKCGWSFLWTWENLVYSSAVQEMHFCVSVHQSYRQILRFQGWGEENVTSVILQSYCSCCEAFPSYWYNVCGNDWRINHVRSTSMTGEVYLCMAGSIHHLFLSMEGLCASGEKPPWCQTKTSIGSVTGCNSILSLDHINGYDTSHKL